MDTNYIIETKNLTKQYGSQKSVADLNIHVKRGRIYGLLGRNGAGKTTTMKMLLGLTKPTSGEVKIWGKPLQGNEKKLLPRIGSLIESPGFYPNLTGTENLRIFATLRGVPNNHAIKDALDLVGLPYKDKKLFSQYSLGMKQRLAIAHALYIRREYEHAMGIAESALLMAGTRYPIDSIYLNIVLCMICMSLKQDERAEQKFDAAWSIASREGYIHPFVEHHGILQGQVERALRKQEPETYNKIVQSVYRFSRGWMKIHNPVSTLQVTDALTPYEFSIAMLAAKGRSNKEIAALMGVSVNTVKSYMESIFEKLQISSRNEIDAYVNR